MPFYFRKSVKAGPFRFTFSKGGVGVSVGVKGFRIGTGPRGHYVHAGMGGIYYRSSIGGGQKPRRVENNFADAQQVVENPAPNVEMIEIQSGDVLEMRDETLGSLLDEINENHRKFRLSVALGWVFGVIGLYLGYKIGGFGYLLPLTALPASAIGGMMDETRRKTVMFYELDGQAEVAYRDLTDAFDILTRCNGKWHVSAAGDINDWHTWKRNAGAYRLVAKEATTLEYKLPDVINSNVTPPAIKVGKQTLYFFPDAVFVEDKDKFGAIRYPDLRVERQTSRFIEEGQVPSDAVVVDHTWRYVNKRGGPDRRFKDNRQIPICLYEVIYFQSASGLNALIEVSQAECGYSFVEAVNNLKRLPQKAPTAAIQSRTATT